MNPDNVDMWIEGRQTFVDFAYEANGRVHFETRGGGDYSFDTDALLKITKTVRRRDRRRAK